MTKTLGTDLLTMVSTEQWRHLCVTDFALSSNVLIKDSFYKFQLQWNTSNNKMNL